MTVQRPGQDDLPREDQTTATPEALLSVRQHTDSHRERGVRLAGKQVVKDSRRRDSRRTASGR